MASGANSSRIAVVGWEPGVAKRRSRPRCCGVAGLAGGWEPGSRVIRIRRGLIVGFVTGEAVGRNGCVVVVHVATGAGHGRVLAGQRKGCGVVIERRRNPGGRVMADFTLLWKSRLNVIRVGGAVEILQVAGGTGGAVQAVVAIHVALRALQRDVRPGQREAGRCVIKDRVRPGRSRVAGITGLREAGLGVIRVSRALVVLQMAGRARAAGQGVVPIDVALCARQAGVCSCKSESRTGVVEGSISPGRGAMAALAGLGDCGLHVIGVGRPLIVPQMAGHARGDAQAVISVDMTLRALQRDVRPGQRETRG